MSRDVVSYPYVGPPKVRCSAHRKNGDNCKRWAIAGGNVCPVHGGSAGHVKRKAAARIEASLDRAALTIVRLMEDPATPHAIKLAAARDLLDRGNLNGKNVVEVQGMQPWQVILQNSVFRATDAEIAEIESRRPNVVDTIRSTALESHTEPARPRSSDGEPSATETAGPRAERANLDSTPPPYAGPERTAGRAGRTRSGRVGR